MTSNFKKGLKVSFGLLAVLVLGCGLYGFTHPLVFNESFFGHAHCMVGAGLWGQRYYSEPPQK